ncbi:F-box/FBD/LRR-repeat protein At1g13570-like [Punica granatum]|uniref:F-box/FBD/LRR-repeat protein At1g13570-like n=1 Tax=Punica granatum TaxID=22663 RepID=A0A218X7B3_PUNGR|nr:F-box/FBD/LRR-repeat protein At1g13570-like [Punica granatum]XP_031386022.1 F-box/FBD/LRR-repeat protein At1g13570-like [Punica granatum]OWM80803.1 hypothetical protein CDL15_Pgr006833 [Punica granatum]
MEEGVDRISDLPAHIMDQILLLLPMKEAARTSILSTKWRYKWASIPELVFYGDMECYPYDRLLIDIVDHVLRSHVGPIVKFKICHEDIYDSRAVNRWIRCLSRMPLKEFIFYNVNWKARKISTRLFEFRNLVHLQLTWCIIKLPARFKGLKKLESLDLSNVSSTQDQIEKLISSSPRLTVLRLWHLEDNIECLNICAPNLQSIDIRSSYEDINFQTPNRLVSVEVGLYRPENQPFMKLRPNVSSKSLCRFLLDLRLVKTLKFKNSTLKCFSDCYIPEKLPEPSVHLKHLSLGIDFGNSKEILTVVCLLRSCPNLEEVEFSARCWDVHHTIGSFWEEYCSPEPFKQVKFLYFENTKGTEAELGLIKFLLLNLPTLERIKVVVSYFEKVGREYLEELIELPRASPQVRFIYEHSGWTFDHLLFSDEELPEAE